MLYSSRPNKTKNETFVKKEPNNAAKVQLRLELHAFEDDAREVYITGTFNGWQAHDDRYKMTKKSNGRYTYSFVGTIDTHGHPFEYKYTKGGWEGEELTNDGLPTANRLMSNPAGKVTDVVPRWKTNHNDYNSSYYPIIEIVSEKFEVPQLSRKRRISVLLPYNYYKDTSKRFPVLYLQDGQNLFENTAPYGTWGIDKKLAKMAEAGKGDLIIVAIDHGGRDRVNEFSPYSTEKFGDGLAKQYALFMTDTLKPYIDRTFRTLADRAHTGIGGSSMGGLFSIYASILHPELFSKYMIFSPSLWIAPQIYEETLNITSYDNTCLYLYVGGNEGKSTMLNLIRWKNILDKTQKRSRNFRVQLDINPKGDHNEATWGNIFPKSAEWLFFEE